MLDRADDVALHVRSFRRRVEDGLRGGDHRGDDQVRHDPQVLGRPRPGAGQPSHQEETEDETRGQWYLRQLLGSANITGGKLFHGAGNLSHQIEHHLFPDLPARRYPQVAQDVQRVCEKYGLPYNTGRLSKQLGSVAMKVCRFALPGKPSPDSQPVVELRPAA